MLVIRRRTGAELQAAARAQQAHEPGHGGRAPPAAAVEFSLVGLDRCAREMEAAHSARCAGAPAVPVPRTPRDPSRLRREAWAARYAYYVHTAQRAVESWLTERLDGRFLDAEGLREDLARHLYWTSATRYRRVCPLK